MSHHHHHVCAVLALSLGALLAACDRGDRRTVGQQVDATFATTERTAQTLTSDARKASRDVDPEPGQAADPAINTSRDAAISAELNARLARDDVLSALHIDVDTAAGHVVLRGSVPDTAARSRVTELAGGVDGVVSVRNELMVQQQLR